MYIDFSTPNRIAKATSEEEIIRLANLYNGVTPCHMSVNPYEVCGHDELGNEIKKVYINRAYFDFDSDPESVKKFVNYLVTKDIKFIINFSGRGHHVYVYCKGEGTSKNLRILQLSLLSEAGVMCDPHIIGDVSRVARIANTWNHKAQKYCIPLQIEEIGREPANCQRFERVTYGSRILNLEEYIEDKFEDLKPAILKDVTINTDISLLPCIEQIVKTINPAHSERYVLVVYLSDAFRCGANLKEFDIKDLHSKVVGFFTKNCSHWLDFDVRKTSYQVRNILPKSNIPADCNFIKSHGGCIGCGADKII